MEMEIKENMKIKKKKEENKEEISAMVCKFEETFNYILHANFRGLSVHWLSITIVYRSKHKNYIRI